MSRDRDRGEHRPEQQGSGQMDKLQQPEQDQAASHEHNPLNGGRPPAKIHHRASGTVTAFEYDIGE